MTARKDPDGFRSRGIEGLDWPAWRVIQGIAESGAGHALSLRSRRTVIRRCCSARGMTGMTLSELRDAWSGQTMGAKRSHLGQAQRCTGSGAGSFNAIRRDYGRLGVLLGQLMARGGRQTDRTERDYLRRCHRLAPAAGRDSRRARRTPYCGYGYQFGLLTGESDALRCSASRSIDLSSTPKLKIVMVVTAGPNCPCWPGLPRAPSADAMWRGSFKQ